jgi:hypothetical protein
MPLLHIDLFYFLKNTKISISGGISKFCLWANFGSFGQIWTNLVALAVVDNHKSKL